jgi:hypothetical protein
MLRLPYLCFIIGIWRSWAPVLVAEIMMKPSFTVLVIVGFLVTFGAKLVYQVTTFSMHQMRMTGSKNGTLGPHTTIFLAGLWWVWRNCNLMCPNNKTWSLTRLCNNIHSSADAISSSFQRDGSVAHTNRLIKWNCNNHPGSILNVDDSCLGTPNLCWLWWYPPQQCMFLSMRLFRFHPQLK